MKDVYNITTKEEVESIIKKSFLGVEMSKHGRNTYYKIGSGFDCETTVTPKKYAFAYVWQFSLNETVFIGRKVRDFYSFMIILDKYLKKRYYRTTHKKPKQFPQLLIYIANFGYEWAFFKTQFARVGIRKAFAKEKRQPLSVSVGNCLEFRECLGLWGNSLAEIAKNYTKTQKLVGELNYSLARNSLTEIDEKHELPYMVNDVRILSELGLLTFERFKGKPIPYTATGIIRNEVKSRIQAKGKLVFNSTKETVHRIYPHTLHEYEKAMKFLFCGGLTHSNYEYVGEHLYDIQCADLTSDYPACMAHNSYPAGSLIPNCTISDMIKYPHYYALFTFTNVRPKTTHTLISEHKLIAQEKATFDNGRVYSADKISVYLNEIDFETFNMFYTYDDDFAVKDIHCFTMSKPIPKELFDVLFEQYLKKAQLKADGKADTPEYIDSKKIVNGCFGFTATRIYISEVEYKDGDLQEKSRIKHFKSMLINRETSVKRYYHTYTVKSQDEKLYKELTKNIWLSPFIAVYTTSYARRILADVITRFPNCIVQYDTDSIYFKLCHSDSAELQKYLHEYNDMIIEKNKKIFDNPLYYDLGTWDFDKPCTQFKCLGAKRYLKKQGGKIKLVAAGCKSKAFVKYCKENNLDYFETFTKGMLLDEFSSMKTTLKYYDKKDKPYTDIIKDYQGNIERVEIDTCAVITDIPFKLTMKDTWLQLIDYWKGEEKKL